MAALSACQLAASVSRTPETRISSPVSCRFICTVSVPCMRGRIPSPQECYADCSVVRGHVPLPVRTGTKGRGKRRIATRAIDENAKSDPSQSTTGGQGGEVSRKEPEDSSAQGEAAGTGKPDGGDNSPSDGKDNGGGGLQGLLGGLQVTPIWKNKEGGSAPGGGLPPQRPVLPKADVEVLRNQVFGFDTFFVTGQEPYEGGMVFKGNLRGEPAKAYEKLAARLKEKFSEQYFLFLLESPDDERCIALVLPSEKLAPLPTAFPEGLAAALFALTTVFSLLQENAGTGFFSILPTLDELAVGVPGALTVAAILLAHEAGHYATAKARGLELGFPFFIPGWQLGSFGAITRIKGIVPSRQALAEVATSGPLAGAAVALLVLAAGFFLPSAVDYGGVVVQVSAFHESFLIGGIAKLVLGDALKEGASVAVSPILLAAWSGLFINAINCIPVGELDGGRMARAVWGRKVASRLSSVSFAVLGLGAIFSDVALFWLILIFILQRGPISPNAEDISAPSQQQIALSAALLVFGVLVYCPYPFDF
eukprot:TRINITY_DN24088_c0_g1_i1.p1 TRINITY_DN24088_c0_g1~~TRINITY_DN24088_c0_g1_i1.p1  ORF type:complete len:537 (+),score=74.48 TRINITY_DN24088_c0_g1_i1:81-1691(+)